MIPVLRQVVKLTWLCRMIGTARLRVPSGRTLLCCGLACATGSLLPPATRELSAQESAAASPGDAGPINRPRATVSELTPALSQHINSLNRRIQQHFGQGEFTAAVPVAELAWRRCLDAVGAEARATQEAAALLATSRKAADLAAEQQQELAVALRRRVELRSMPPPVAPVGAADVDPFDSEPLRRDAHQAEAYRHVASTLARCLGDDDSLVAATRLKWAWFEYAHGNWSHARSLAEDAQAVMSQRFGARYVGMASCAELIGLIHIQQQRDRAARSAFDQAIDLYTEELGPRHPTVRRCRAQLAYLMTRSGQYAQAAAMLSSVLDEAHGENEDPRELIRILLLLSHQLTESGEWVRAEAMLREALNSARDDAPAGRAQVAAILAQLSSCLRSLGRDAEAEQAAAESYRRIVELYGSQHPQTARGAWNLAHARYAAGNYDAALTSVAVVLQLQQRFDNERDQPLTRQARQLRIECERQLGRPTATDDYEQLLRQRLQQAREENSNGNGIARLALACGELAIFLSETHSSVEAAQLLDEAIRLSQQSLGTDHEQSIVLQQRRGEHEFLSGNLPQAIEVLQQAAGAAARTRVSRGRSGLTGLSRGSFNRRLPLLAIALATQGDASAAWQRLEEGKARGLWDDLQRRTTSDGRASARDPGSQLAWTGEPFSLARVQRQIPLDAALVTWTGVVWKQHNRGEYWACVLRARGEPRWIRLTGSGQHQSLSNEERSLSGQSLASAMQAPTHRARVWDSQEVRVLYEQRFAPLVPALEATDALPKVRRLIVVYPGPTHLPLEVLTDELTISYAPSATIYAWLKERSAETAQDSPGELLAVGAPVFGRENEPATATDMSRILPARDLPALPGARREVESLGMLFGARATTMLGESANTVQLAELARAGRLREFSYLHFATHGEANQRVPLQSALILGQMSATELSLTQTRRGVATDDRLTAEQILNDWQLNASLVTLSACETALGPAVEGEHLVGFSQAFLLAGSRSVVASMWAVRDDATSLLMHRFYQNLLGERAELPRPLPKAEALHEAKQWIRQLTVANLDQEVREAPAELRSRIRSRIAASAAPAARPFSDPYFWAPFILIGDDE